MLQRWVKFLNMTV